jgi:VanZ family protein
LKISIFSKLKMTQILYWLQSLGKQTYRFLAMFWLGLTLTLSLISGTKASQLNIWDLVGIDKIGHLGFYMILSYLWSMAMRFHSSKQYVVLLVIIFGIIMEICQYSLMMGRAFEWLDVASNSLGAVIGFYLYVFTTNYKSTPSV